MPASLILATHHVPHWALHFAAAPFSTLLAQGEVSPIVVGDPCAGVAVEHHDLLDWGLWVSPGSLVASMPSPPATSIIGMASGHKFNHIKADNVRRDKLLTAVAT